MTVESLKRNVIYIISFLFLAIGLSLQFKSSGSISNYLNSGSYVIQIFSILAALFCLFNGEKIFFEKRTKSRNAWSIIMSIVLAITVCLGRINETYKSISVLYTAKGLIFGIWNIAAFSIFLFLMINSLYIWLFLQVKYHDLASSSAVLKTWFLYTIVIILLWCLLLIIYYPGIWGWDGMDQINQFFAMKSDGRQFYLTNHHPYLTTVIMAHLFKLGLHVSVNFGVFLIVIVNICLLACSISFLTITIRTIIGKKTAFSLFMFFVAFPIFPMWAIVVDKTAYFLAAYVFFIAELLICWSKISNAQKIENSTLIWLSISGVMVGLTRNDGFLYVLFAIIGIIVLIHFAKNVSKSSKQTILSLGISFVVIILFNSMLLPMFKVLPTEPMEPMAVPLQQIARVATVNPNGITKGQQKQLNYYLDYKEMKKNYDPNFFDPIKYTVRFPMWKLKGDFKSRQKQFKNTPIVKKKMEFYKIWLAIGLHNPRIYLDSFLTGHMGFIYPVDNGASTFIWNSKPLNGGSSKYEYTKYEQEYAYAHPKLREKVAFKVIVKLQYSSLFAVFLNCSFWFWMAAIISCLLLCYSTSKNLIWFLQCFVVLGVAFLGPINLGLRYIFPFLIIVPVMICILCLYIKDDNEKEQQ